MTKQTGHTLLLLAASLIWGLAFVAQSMGSDLGAYTFLASRSWVALGILLPMILAFDTIRKKRGAPAGGPKTKADKKRLFLGAFTCGTALFAASAAQQIAITIDPSTAKASFITAMYVVLVPVGGILIGRRCGAQVWCCVALSVLGLYLLCMQGGFGSISASDWILLLCAALFSCQILLVDYFSPLVDGIRLSFGMFFVEAVWSTIFAFAFEQPAWGQITAAALPILYCGLLSSGLGYTFQILGQEGLNPAVASLAMCPESVFGALGGWLILGQTLTGREIGGCALIFAAVVLAQVPLKALCGKAAAGAEENG
ncbi:MAG: DMT family transporter [Faecalibacterium sp.]|jgi:drug/metabolite transporter (DMT)-like permease|nr:DMT family transporter [Faecalibacterium sp.]